MTANPVAALVLFSAAGTLGLATNLIFYAMIGEINGRAEEGQGIPYFFFSPRKYARIFREYKRLCPTGRLAFYSHLTAGAAVALLLAAVWQFGFLSALLRAMARGSPSGG